MGVPSNYRNRRVGSLSMTRIQYRATPVCFEMKTKRGLPVSNEGVPAYREAGQSGRMTRTFSARSLRSLSAVW